MSDMVDDSVDQVVLGHITALYDYLGWDLEKSVDEECWSKSANGCNEKYTDRIKEKISGRLGTIRMFLESGYLDCRYCKKELLQMARKLEDKELEELVVTATITSEIEDL